MRANAERLPYSENDFAHDVRKTLLKHAGEFGLSDREDYLAKARAIVHSADRVFVRQYWDEGLQYSFFSEPEGGYAIVDTSMTLRGCFGPKTKGWIEQCQTRLTQQQSELTGFGAGG